MSQARIDEIVFAGSLGLLISLVFYLPYISNAATIRIDFTIITTILCCLVFRKIHYFFVWAILAWGSISLLVLFYAYVQGEDIRKLYLFIGTWQYLILFILLFSFIIYLRYFVKHPRVTSFSVDKNIYIGQANIISIPGFTGLSFLLGLALFFNLIPPWQIHGDRNERICQWLYLETVAPWYRSKISLNRDLFDWYGSYGVGNYCVDTAGPLRVWDLRHVNRIEFDNHFSNNAYVIRMNATTKIFAMAADTHYFHSVYCRFTESRLPTSPYPTRLVHFFINNNNFTDQVDMKCAFY